MLEETCRQHFSTIADLTDHTREHKELMRRRLICTYDVSRNAVCGQKFTNRREFNAHCEEHVTVFKAKTFTG